VLRIRRLQVVVPSASGSAKSKRARSRCIRRAAIRRQC
jgi:hypothetical protein